MHIHWFPGHMAKAFGLMRREMKFATSVIYVLDARAPMSSINPEYDKIINTKPTLYILNKADLVTPQDILEWKEYFQSQSKTCISYTSLQKGAKKQIFTLLKQINADFLKRNEEKGVRKAIRAMVIGVPNCGKSAFINSLIGGKKTITGNKPGVTRGKQWVSVDRYIELMDTPGTLYPDFKDHIKARNLAFIGSISDEVVDTIELASELLEFLKQRYLKNLKQRYKIEHFTHDDMEDLKEIGKKRGYIAKGGDVDIEKTAKAVIQDFRKNALGKIILERKDEITKD